MGFGEEAFRGLWSWQSKSRNLRTRFDGRRTTGHGSCNTGSDNFTMV